MISIQTSVYLKSPYSVQTRKIRTRKNPVQAKIYFFINLSELNPQGYGQKRKLFHTNSFVLAHSSGKKFYIEQLTVNLQYNGIT